MKRPSRTKQLELLPEPEPVNYDGTSDSASAEFVGKLVTVHDGTVGRQYLVEVIGF